MKDKKFFIPIFVVLVFFVVIISTLFASEWTEVEEAQFFGGGSTIDTTSLTYSLMTNVSYGTIKQVRFARGSGSTESTFFVYVNQSGVNLASGSVTFSGTSGEARSINLSEEDYSSFIKGAGEGEGREFTVEIHRTAGDIALQTDQTPTLSEQGTGIFNVTKNAQNHFVALDGDGQYIVFAKVEPTLNVTLISPLDSQTVTKSTFNLSVDFLDPNNLLQNATVNVYFTNGTLHFSETNSSSASGSLNFSNTFPDGNYEWNVTAYNNSYQAHNTDNGTLSFTVEACSYSSGNWEINLIDNCILNDNQDISPNDLIVRGDSGTLTINASITTRSFHFIPDDFDGDSQIRIFPGGRLVRKP